MPKPRQTRTASARPATRKSIKPKSNPTGLWIALGGVAIGGVALAVILSGNRPANPTNSNSAAGANTGANTAVSSNRGGGDSSRSNGNSPSNSDVRGNTTNSAAARNNPVVGPSESQQLLGIAKQKMREGATEASKRFAQLFSQRPANGDIASTPVMISDAVYEEAKRLAPILELWLNSADARGPLSPTAEECHYFACCKWGIDKNSSVAEHWWERAISLRPGYADALACCAEMYRKLKQVDRALAAVNAALKSEPTHALARWIRGQLLFFDKSELAEAERDFDEVIKQYPDAEFPRSARGMLRLNQRNNRGAIEDFSVAIKVAPNEPSNYSYRGQCYLDLRQADDCIADLSSAIRLGDTSAATYAIRGMGYLQLRDLDKARKDADASLARNSTQNWEGYFVRGGCQADKKAKLNDFITAYKQCTVEGPRRMLKKLIEELGGTAPN